MLVARVATFVACMAVHPIGPLKGWIEARTPVEDEAGVMALRVVHLLAFATAWGMSLWVSFVGGIIMYRNLPRHQFGKLQSKLLPVYFETVAVCAVLCTTAFALLHPFPSATQAQRSELGNLVISLGATLSNVMVFEPLTTWTMQERHKIEREEGIGDEVGLSKNKEVAKRNPKLANLNMMFGIFHFFSMLSNLISLGGFAAHLWYLAGKLAL